MRPAMRLTVGVVVVIMTAALWPVAVGASGGSGRPFKASGSASGIFNTDTESFVIDGTLTGTHIGKSTAHIVGDTAAGTGTTTVTAANGDTLIFVADSRTTDIDNSACPPGLPGATQQPSTIHGGTGRFAGATGHIVATTCAGFGDTEPDVLLTVAFTAVGTINY